MSEEHLEPHFPEENSMAAQRELDFRNAQVIQDLYFLHRTDLEGNPKALWEFYLKFTSPKREDMLRSFAENLQKDSPITFIRLVEQTVTNNSKTVRRDYLTSDSLTQQWQAWRRRMYREYPPILFPGEEGNRRWEQAIDIMNRAWQKQAF